MEQLVFELAAAEPPLLSNFLPGRNAEIVAALPGFVTGRTGETGLFLWGAPGAGKSHLLRAAQALAEQAGHRCAYCDSPASIDDGRALSALTEVVLVDRIDEADEIASAHLFTVYNALKERGGRFMATSRIPPAAVDVREDLRTRLGWGLVYEVFTLRDEEKTAAVQAYALQRGFTLGDDVLDYWMRHGRRDMPSLLRTLAAVDRYSLSTKRPITVPLLRDWLQREANGHPNGQHAAGQSVSSVTNLPEGAGRNP